MKYLNNLLLPTIVAASMILTGCDKTKPYDIQLPPAEVHFLGPKNQTYSVIADPAPTFYVVVGTTTKENFDRTAKLNIASVSGLVENTDYTVSRTTLNFPSGKVLDTIAINANFASFPFGSRDTLVLTLGTPSIQPAAFQDTIRLIITGPSACSEASPTLSNVLGDYANTNELLGTNPYGPYTTSISAATQTGPTTGQITVENIWDNGWGPINFILDWTDPANPTTQVVPQSAIPGSNAGDLNSTYAGQTVAVRVPAGSISASAFGTYSYCDETFVLNMQLGVTNLGFFGILYQVTMER